MRDTLKGKLDYYLRPGLRDGAELYSSAWRGMGPMNGQTARLHTTTAILDAMDVQTIVETGTYRGVTTEWFANRGVGVHTIEVDPRLYGYACIRLRNLTNVTTHLGSSPEVLKELTHGRDTDERIFFYLDAHWDQHIPLPKELAVIFEHWRYPVVMVDDFKVPGDSYGYLDRGPGNVCDTAMLGAYAKLPRWYPATAAWCESGQNTGWCVLTTEANAAVLTGINGLRLT